MNKNYGFSKANNIAINKILSDSSDVDYVGLINSDARLSETWAENMISFVTKKRNLACAQGTTLDYYNDSIIDSTHIYVSRNGSAVQGGWKKYYKGEFGPKKIFGVNAAAALVSCRFIKDQPRQKLFDESYFMYLEDVDIALRSTLSGWDNYLVPGARAWHMGSASTSKRSSSFSLYYTYRNNLGMLIKNFPVSVLIKVMPRLVKGDYLTIKHLRRTNQSRLIYTLIKGRVVSIFRSPIYLIKHFSVTHHKINKKYLWTLMINGF